MTSKVVNLSPQDKKRTGSVTGGGFGLLGNWTFEDLNILRKMVSTSGRGWYIFSSSPDADIMERLTALKGVPPAVKATLIELGELS
jgi:hypothetical protein